MYVCIYVCMCAYACVCVLRCSTAFITFLLPIVKSHLRLLTDLHGNAGSFHPLRTKAANQMKEAAALLSRRPCGTHWWMEGTRPPNEWRGADLLWLTHSSQQLLTLLELVLDVGRREEGRVQESCTSLAQFHYAGIAYWFLLGKYNTSLKPLSYSWYQAGAHIPWFRMIMRIMVINLDRLPQIVS